MINGPKNLDVALLSRTLPSQEAWLSLLSFAQEGDMVKAAQKLMLTQPALSFHLKKLESQLGFSLFSFSGKKKVLTKLGHEYVKRISKILSEAHLATEHVLKSAHTLETQTLRVAGRRELMLPFLSFPFPGQMELVQTSSAESLRLLREHKVDLAISAKIQDSSDLMAKLFFASNLKIIYPKKWQKPKMTTYDLLDRPLIAYGNHHAYLKEFLQFKGKKITEMKVSRIVEDWFSVVELVKHEFGWAVIPDAWEVHADSVGMMKMNDADLAPQKIYLFYRRDERKSAWVGLLDQWLQKELQNEETVRS
jgi:DNA-binding transcriptional LysR family regulator